VASPTTTPPSPIADPAADPAPSGTCLRLLELSKSGHSDFVNALFRQMAVFDRNFAALAAERGPPLRLRINTTHLKAHRIAASLIQKGHFPAA
jgi:hypothetical protein